MPGVPGNAEMMTSGKIDEGTRRFSPSFLSGRRAASLRNSGMEGFRPLLFKALPPLRKFCRRLPEGRKKVPSGAAPDVFRRERRGELPRKNARKSRGEKPAELPSPRKKNRRSAAEKAEAEEKQRRRRQRKNRRRRQRRRKRRKSRGQGRRGTACAQAGESLLHEEAAER